ncbi:MAG: hypothetical protein ACFFAH_10620, partial [Promethearchaeota archaeon]
MIFVAWVYETIIVSISTILLILILMKFFERRHELTLYLFLVFIFFTLAIFFSWVSKFLVLFSNIQYIKDIYKPTDPGTIESWFVLRIVDFRFSFIFTTIAIYFSYVFKIKIFHSEYNKNHRIIVIAFGIWTIFYNLFIYVAGSQLLMAFAFFFPFVYMSMIYFPFMKCSVKSCIDVDDRVFKKAFLSLVIMCIGFMLIFFFFTIDRILILQG